MPSLLTKDCKHCRGTGERMVDYGQGIPYLGLPRRSSVPCSFCKDGLIPTTLEERRASLAGIPCGFSWEEVIEGIYIEQRCVAGKVSMKGQVHYPCDYCKGTGAKYPPLWVRCTCPCHGERLGILPYEHRIGSVAAKPVPCPRCQGRGYTVSERLEDWMETAKQARIVLYFGTTTFSARCGDSRWEPLVLMRPYRVEDVAGYIVEAVCKAEEQNDA